MLEMRSGSKSPLSELKQSFYVSMKTCPFLIFTIYVEPRTISNEAFNCQQMVAECLVLLDWGFTDAPPQIRCKSKLRLDNKFRFDLCEPGFPLTQSSIRFELANIRFNQLFNKLPTCSWVCSEYIFWKGQDCVLFHNLPRSESTEIFAQFD